MSGLTSRVGLYLPGGGSLGIYGPDEPLDVDKINGNFKVIDAGLGIPSYASTARPGAGVRFVDMVIYETDTDTYKRWNGAAWVEGLPKSLATTALDTRYFTQAKLTAGALDTRYYTQTQLLTGTVLDSHYPSRSVRNNIVHDMLPFNIAGGSVDINPSFDASSGNYTGTVAVSFPAGRFDDNPFVVATADSGDTRGVTIQVEPGTRTTTGCRLRMVRPNNVTTSACWIAYRSKNS